MKKRQILITILTVCMLLAAFAAFQWRPFPSKSGAMSSKNKPAYQEKKVALIPIVVIGGLRFYRKIFEKK